MLHTRIARIVASTGMMAGAIWLAPAPVKAADIVIAAVHSLTGPIAFLGVPATNAMKIAVDDLNAQHFLGNDKIVLEVLDDGTNTGQMTTLLNRAALQDKALVILGPSDSTRSMAAGSIVNDLKVPTITTGQTDATFKSGPWIFKVTTNPDGVVKPIAEYAAEKLKLKRVAAVYLRDNDGQIAPMRTFTEFAAAHGAEVVDREGVLLSDTDFTAAATKIVSLHADGVFLGMNAEQAANVALQLRQAGLPPSAALFGLAGLGLEYMKFGGTAVNNTYTVLDYNVQSQSPMNQAFVAEYKKRYGQLPDNWAAVGYTSVQVAAQAIKDAGPNPTREGVREAMMKLKDVPVVLGSGKWTENPNRVPEYGEQVVTIQNGKVIPAP